jgi:hypothetical protein
MCELAQPAHRRDRVGSQGCPLLSAYAGDLGEGIVVAPGLAALDVEPLAHRAVLDRIRVRGVGVQLLGQFCFESGFGETVIGHHLGRPEPVDAGLQTSSDDRDLRRHPLLNPVDLLDVGADLDQRAGFHAVGELGVGHLVMPIGAQVAGGPERKASQV